MDGTDPSRIVTGGVGSKRYRITWKGPADTGFGGVRPGEPDGGDEPDGGRFLPDSGSRKAEDRYAASVTGG